MASDAQFRRNSVPVRFITTAFFFTAHLLLCSSNAYADTRVLIARETSLPYTYKFNDQSLEEGYELQLQGENNSDSVLILIIRIDNDSSYNYQTRFNRNSVFNPVPISSPYP